jgi:hypothetical protein
MLLYTSEGKLNAIFWDKNDTILIEYLFVIFVVDSVTGHFEVS